MSEDTRARLIEALQVIAEALKEPAGGSYWPARQYLDRYDKFHEDLDEDRVLLQVAELALADTQLERPAEEWVEAPNEQAWWWHWNGEDYAVPHIHSVMVSLTGKHRYFIADGSGRWCDEMGGRWLKIDYPNIPPRIKPQPPKSGRGTGV